MALARPVALAALIVGLALVAALDPRTSGAMGNRALLVGDSIFFQTREELDAVLTDEGWQPHVAALPATTIADWVEPLGALVEEHAPDVVVVELGTNEDVDRPDLGHDVLRILRRLSGVDRVVWLNVQEDAEYPRGAGAINHVVESSLVWADNAELLDFSGHFADHTEWHALEPEGVHMSVSGEQELARFVAAALGRAEP
jgi:hypothetical protein